MSDERRTHDPGAAYPADPARTDPGAAAPRAASSPVQKGRPTKRRLGAREIWLTVGAVLLAFNLRPALVTVSPVIGQIRDSTGLSAAGAGLLTTLPVLCFGALSIVVPMWARRLGDHRLVMLSMVALAVA